MGTTRPLHQVLFAGLLTTACAAPLYGQQPTTSPVSDIYGHLGVGTLAPDRSALLDLTSADAGFLLPRMPIAARDAIFRPAHSLLLFNAGTEEFNYNSGTPDLPVWSTFLTTINMHAYVWALEGNQGIDPSSMFLGTVDGSPLAFRTGDTERMRIVPTGNIGIGTSSPDPSALLDLRTTGGGLLIPRVTSLQRNAIPSPATGLLIYNTSTNAFNVNLGTPGAPDWKALLDEQDAWLRTGNTASPGDILGTTNAQDLNIAAGGTIRMTLDDATGNVGIGAPVSISKLNVAGRINTSTVYGIGENTVLSVAGTNNLFVGVDAGGSNTTGVSNAFVGRSAGAQNTDGFFNAFLGMSAGTSNTSGSDNTFAGYSAGRANTTGNFNLFLGAFSGFFNQIGNNNAFVGALSGMFSTGDDNTFMGIGAGQFNMSGGSNVFMGANAGFSNGAGNDNTFVGVGAGNLSTGNGNAFFGFAAGGFNETGNFNTYIGNGASGGGTTSSSIGIGYGADVTADHQLVVGSDDPNGRIDASFWGNGVVSASPMPFAVNATGGSGQDVGGADLRIAAGIGTGAAAGGSIVFRTSPADVVTSDIPNALQDRMTITPTGGVGIGAAPGASSLLELTSTDRGFVLPRMSPFERNMITAPIAGMMIYQTDNTPGLRVYDGTGWVRFTETADP